MIEIDQKYEVWRRLVVDESREVEVLRILAENPQASQITIADELGLSNEEEVYADISDSEVVTPESAATLIVSRHIPSESMTVIYNNHPTSGRTSIPGLRKRRDAALSTIHQLMLVGATPSSTLLEEARVTQKELEAMDYGK